MLKGEMILLRQNLMLEMEGKRWKCVNVCVCTHVHVCTCVIICPVVVTAKKMIA